MLNVSALCIYIVTFLFLFHDLFLNNEDIILLKLRSYKKKKPVNQKGLY